MTGSAGLTMVAHSDRGGEGVHGRGGSCGRAGERARKGSAVGKACGFIGPGGAGRWLKARGRQ